MDEANAKLLEKLALKPDPHSHLHYIDPLLSVNLVEMRGLNSPSASPRLRD